MFSLLNMKTQACFFYVLKAHLYTSELSFWPIQTGNPYLWIQPGIVVTICSSSTLLSAKPEWGIPHAPDFIPLGSWKTGLLIDCWNNTKLLNKGQVTRPSNNSSLFSNHFSGHKTSTEDVLRVRACIWQVTGSPFAHGSQTDCIISSLPLTSLSRTENYCSETCV